MKLRHLGLCDFELEIGNGDLAERYRQESWCISQYMTRLVRKERIETGSFNALFIAPMSKRSLRESRQGGDNLNVDAPFDWEAYGASNDPIESHRLLFNLFKSGLERVPAKWGLPVGRLLVLLNGFQDGGNVNRWSFKRRLFRDHGIKAMLDCDLSLRSFELTLTVSKAKDILFKDVILRTNTDPLDWYYEFKDVVLVDRRLYVLKRNHLLAKDGSFVPDTLFALDVPSP